MKKLKSGMRYILVALICLLCLSPFIILVIISLNTPQRNMYEGNMLIPEFYFGNYAEGWEKSRAKMPENKYSHQLQPPPLTPLEQLL